MNPPPHDGVLQAAYINYRGVTQLRRIAPLERWFGATEYYPELQWFLKAYDFDKGEVRDFALRDFLGFGDPRLTAGLSARILEACTFTVEDAQRLGFGGEAVTAAAVIHDRVSKLLMELGDG